MDELRQAIYGIAEADHPVTVRQVFYRLVSLGLIEKAEREYKNVAQRLLGELREDGTIPFAWIADSTRWMRKPASFSDLQSALRAARESYRRALWDTQPHYVEVWLEKEALSGVLYPITAEWDIPLMVTRGYASKSFLHEAAQVMAPQNRPCVLFYFSDHDPSGANARESVLSTLRRYAPEAQIEVWQLAVTPAQVEALDLPLRPTKQSDSRAKGWTGGSVEIDAIPPRQLKSILTEAIESLVDPYQLALVKAAEQDELRVLTLLESNFEGAA
jgi:hypothetical protein